jgi:hypothetical protein
MPDLWGFGAEDERARSRGRQPPRAREGRAGPVDRLADLIQRIGKLFG